MPRKEWKNKNPYIKNARINEHLLKTIVWAFLKGHSATKLSSVIKSHDYVISRQTINKYYGLIGHYIWNEILRPQTFLGELDEEGLDGLVRMFYNLIYKNGFWDQAYERYEGYDVFFDEHTKKIFYTSQQVRYGIKREECLVYFARAAFLAGIYRMLLDKGIENDIPEDLIIHEDGQDSLYGNRGAILVKNAENILFSCLEKKPMN